MIRKFDLVRQVDVTGVSGCGRVAHGWTLPFGMALLVWPGTWPTCTLHLRGAKSVEAIHGHSGSTRIEWS